MLILSASAGRKEIIIMANKLELTWYGKDKPIVVEPRILIEDASRSNCAADPDTENMLIHGDNLLALKALESKYAGQVKCIYIDPPYNTGSAFEHYDDNLEHSTWLNLMRPRLQILWKMLSEEGSLWISIDDDEQAYMKVLCDELCGREHFVSSMIWQKRTSPDMRAVISDGHEYILLYVKNKELFKTVRNKLPLSEEQAASYKNPDNDPRGAWTSADYTAQGYRPNQMYVITTPGGAKYTPPEGKCWKNVEEVFLQQVAENRIWFGPDGNAMPRRKTFLSEHEGVIPWTWWANKDVGHSQEAKKEIIALFGTSNVFDTPKPERLIQRIIHIATNPGDLVLDSFLGSGTTAAVAHKMGRRYIGIEMGDHAYTHCKVRLDKVISGEDKGGVTKSAGWTNGGGYRFYELAPSLINEDPFGEAVINPAYDADMLAAAMALHEGFTYQPDSSLFWKQSVGNENSYLFVTTRHLNSTFLDSIRDTMQDGEYLIIACRSFDAGLEKAYGNITIKKIPQMLLDRCEFGKTDYALNIVHPPVYEDEEEYLDE
jgi:adenine-specific DNA-methyltransferase